ncbi:MAG: 3-oxoacyl-acyl-carrier protein reductase [Nitrospirae bacterium]|nr:MAG: 3-oxoacyl-acyl-carrier protein reductase [Nitrospirota bacterium]
MSSQSATGKVVLITGAAGGLGFSLVREFALADHRVAVQYRTAEGLARTLCAEFPDRTLSVRADVSDFSSVQAAVADVLAAWGRLDVLVNSAGITRDAVLIRQQEADWDEVMAVNLTGVFHSVRAAAAAMTGGGHIVMLSSYSGLKGKEGQAAYSASKAGLFGLAKTAAIELGPAGICVNAVLPGYLPVGMGPRAESAMKKAQQESLLGCLSDPGEAARFVVHLTTMRSVTGQIFCLDSRIV